MIESTKFWSPTGIGAIHELIVSSPPIIELPASRHGRCQVFFIFIPLCRVGFAKKLERTNNVWRSCSTFSLNYHDLRRCLKCGVESRNDKMAVMFLLKVMLVVSPVSLEQKTCIRRCYKSSSFFSSLVLVTFFQSIGVQIWICDKKQYWPQKKSRSYLKYISLKKVQ